MLMVQCNIIIHESGFWEGDHYHGFDFWYVVNERGENSGKRICDILKFPVVAFYRYHGSLHRRSVPFIREVDFVLLYFCTFLLRDAIVMTEREETVQLLCAICNDHIAATDEFVNVGAKGIRTLVNACEVKKNEKLVSFFKSHRDSSCKIPLHVGCRKRLVDLRNIQHDEKEWSPPSKKTRSSTDTFDWKSHCFICGTLCDFKHDARNHISRVETLSLRDNVLKVCNENSDKLSELSHRVQSCFDLVAAKAVYHSNCLVKLFASPSLQRNEARDERPAEEKMSDEKSGISKPGRPENPVTADAFRQTCEWLESNCEPKSLQEVEQHMSTIIGDENDMCSRKWMKKRLEEKYQDNILFSSDGYRDIIILKDMAQCIINEKWYDERKKDVVEEKKRIITAAAKLIKAEIREMSCDTTVYPSVEEAQSTNWIPDGLRYFLSHFTSSDLKVESVL